MKSKEEIEKLAEKEYREYPNNPLDKPEWHYNKDVNCHKKRKAFIKGYIQCQKDIADKKYTEEDIRQAFRAGDKYRLYLDKWATGIATEGLPDVTMIHTTMSENAFINSLNKQDNESKI